MMNEELRAGPLERAPNPFIGKADILLGAHV